MPEITGEGYISNRVNAAGTYYMFLVIDGQKQRRTTGTKDEAAAQAKLEEWKTQVKAGVKEDARVRYEKIRDAYLSSGKEVQGSILDDLNVFFKNRYLSSITPTVLKQFRQFREHNKVVLENKERSYHQEVELRKLKLGRKVTPKELKQIEAEARQWVENGVKATTNKRLTILRAMFNHAAKEEIIGRRDVPYFPIAEGVDNVRTDKVSRELLQNILDGIEKRTKSTRLHPYILFLAGTGRRSGQVNDLTWDNVSEDRTTLTFPQKPGTTKLAPPLTLVNSKGKPFEWSEWIVRTGKRVNGAPIFDTTDFRNQWRLACHKLKIGIFNKTTQTYRGLRPHDFRRAVATRLGAKGIDRSIGMSMTGHKTDTMYRRYQIPEVKSQQKAFEEIEGD